MARTPTVPAKAEGHATTAEATVQDGLAERTWNKLQSLLVIDDDLPAQTQEQALDALREAFREANCHATLFNVSYWDLAGNSRINGETAEGEAIVIPCTELPKVGTIIAWGNLSYYIGSHKEVK